MQPATRVASSKAMNALSATAGRRSSRAWLILVLGSLALAALWFIGTRALPYFNVSDAQYGPYFWPRRWGLVLHVAGGIVALTVGVVQLWLGLTNRTAALHRALGKTYVGAVIVGGFAGLYLALTIPSTPAYAAGLTALCVAWAVTTSMAVFAIRRRHVLQHREWMMRSYAVTFGFVVFRFGVDALVKWKGMSPIDAQTIMAWAAWAMPLVLIEPLLQLNRDQGFLRGR